ncbi:MAG TPA: GntR family transcriptional regulator [Chthoniobacteraceae bacterium]|nr:GntR family transcriptional regulator [Chthoniobacteraceae bacterium]
MTKVEQISSALRERILAGEWVAGKALPSRGDFAQEYAVSPATVTAAIRCLQKEGLLRVMQGRGAFVTDYEKNGAAPVPNALIGLTGGNLPSDEELSRLGVDRLFTREIFDGIWKAANREHSPVVLLPGTATQKGVTSDYCRQIGVQGLIFLGGERYADALALRQEGFPVILSNKPLGATPLNYVDYDNGWVVREVVRHFTQQGRGRIGVLYSEGSVPAYFEGMKLEFLAALQQTGEVYPIADYWRNVVRVPGVRGRFEGVEAETEALLALSQPPTALFCWEPGMEAAVRTTLERHGLTEKIAVLVSAYSNEEDVVSAGFVMPHCELGTLLVEHLHASIRNAYHCAQILLRPRYLSR